MAKIQAAIFLWRNRELVIPLAAFLLFLAFLFMIGNMIVFVTLIAAVTGNVSGLPGYFRVGGPTPLAMADIPPQYVDVFKSAGQKYEIPWTILAAMAKHDSNFGQDINNGFIYLSEGHWDRYGLDGDMDGVICNQSPWDSVYTVASYLRNNEFGDNPAGALYSIYRDPNHVQKITLTAEDYTDVLLPMISGRWPLPREYTTISSPFGTRNHPVKKEQKHHTGIDIPAPTGTPIYPASDGTVIAANWSGNYGKLVVIQHDRYTQTWYAHLSQINVSKGQDIKREDVLGLVGSTGMSTGPHLHFEVRLNGEPINPEPWLTHH